MLKAISNVFKCTTTTSEHTSTNRTRRYTRERENSIENTTAANQLYDKKIKQLNYELHIAITTGLEIKKIEEILKQGADPNGFIPNLQTYPMKDAIEHDKLEIVELLLAYKANIHGHSQILNSTNFYTNLSCSTRKNNYALVELLLKKTDLNYKISSCYNTPLGIAADHNNVKIAELLLDHGAKVDGLNNSLSPLYYSINGKDNKVSKLLLERGANTTMGKNHYKQSLCKTIEFGYPDALSLLLKYTSKDQFKNIINSIMPALMNCSYAVAESFMKVLFDHGYKIDDYFNFLDHDNHHVQMTLLMKAIIDNGSSLKLQVKFIMLLLANNANPNYTYENGITLIEKTIENNRIDIAFQLRRYGAIADATIISTIIDKYGIDPSTTPRSLKGLAADTIKKHFKNNIKDLPIPTPLKKYIEENEVFV